MARWLRIPLETKVAIFECRRDSKLSYARIAEKYGLSLGTVYRICTGKDNSYYREPKTVRSVIEDDYCEAKLTQRWSMRRAMLRKKRPPNAMPELTLSRLMAGR